MPDRLAPRIVTVAARPLVALLLIALAAPGPGRAEDPAAAEPAIARTADDPSLAWGPCPEFLPAGCAIAVLHGDPAQENVDILFRVPGGAEIAPHWHSSAERMILVAGELHVTYDGQAEVVLRPGAYAYGPPKRPHRARCASADPCVLFIAFEAPLDAVPVGAAVAE
jgi:quercetin dioxygenase-like cupin family protein